MYKEINLGTSTPLTKKVALKSRNSLIAPYTKRWMWNQNSQHWLWEIWYMEMWGFAKAKAWKHCSRFRSYKFIYKSRCVPNFKIEWWWIGIAGIFLVQTSVSTGRDVPLSLCPRTKKSLVPGQGQDQMSRDKLLCPGTSQDKRNF